VVLEAEGETGKGYYNIKAEEGIRIAAEFDETTSEKNKWLVSIINQKWGIELGTRYDRQINLQQFLTKIEESAQGQDKNAR